MSQGPNISTYHVKARDKDKKEGNKQERNGTPQLNVHTHNGLTHSNTIVLSHEINYHCAMVVGRECRYATL